MSMAREEAIASYEKLYKYMVGDEKYIGLSYGEFMDLSRYIHSLLCTEKCCKNCDYWNTWDHAGHKDLKNYVCSCAHWTSEDGCTQYTKPDDFCSYFEPREEETP